jgi:L-iditol 2-dehydrogenase
MKAAEYDNAADEIRIVEKPVPEIGYGEILLRPMAVGLCTSELIPGHLKKGGSLGHELAGVVYRLGKGVKNLREGDRVFVQHHVPCMSCHFCGRGYYTMCDRFREFGFDPTGYAEYTRVKEPHVRIGVIPLPAHVSFEEGSVIEPVSCVVSAFGRAGIALGDTVLVVGAGFVGLVAVQIAKLFGAGRIMVTDSVEVKLKKAEDLGADVVIDRGKEEISARVRGENEGRKADIVLNTAPTIEAVSDSITLAERGGTVIQFGGTSPSETVSINPYEMLVSDITYLGTYSSSHLDTRMTAQLIAQGRIDLRSLITDVFPLDQLNAAMERKRRSPESFKVVIHPNG